MLNAPDAEKLLTASQALGFENTEIYCEHSRTSYISYQGRTDSIRLSARQGISLTAKRAGVSHRFFVDGFQIENVLAALEGKRATMQAPNSLPATPPVWNTLGDVGSVLLQATRSAFSTSNELLQFPFISMALTERQYQVIQDGGGFFQGREENAEFKAEWFVGTIAHQWERARGSLSGLVTEVNSPLGLGRAVKTSLSPLTRWPAPRGRVPVLWSARSVAKIQMLFLRAFEGDRVLDHRSFLNEVCLPLDLAFTLEDRPSHSGDEVDHEGSPRKAITFFRDGRPTALACNKKLAAQLEVPSTGHARRQSFDAPSTVGFWHLHLEGKTTRDALLPLMQQGISVREIEVLSYDPGSGEVSLKLSEAYLVHQGAEGEPMEPLLLQLPLTELLQSFSEFEKDRPTTGLTTGKERQKIFTEITVPAALSSPLLLPGSVPANHYW